jgi:hypothetical protein
VRTRDAESKKTAVSQTVRAACANKSVWWLAGRRQTSLSSLGFALIGSRPQIGVSLIVRGRQPNCTGSAQTTWIAPHLRRGAPRQPSSNPNPHSEPTVMGALPLFSWPLSNGPIMLAPFYLSSLPRQRESITARRLLLCNSKYEGSPLSTTTTSAVTT